MNVSWYFSRTAIIIKYFLLSCFLGFAFVLGMQEKYNIAMIVIAAIYLIDLCNKYIEINTVRNVWYETAWPIWDVREIRERYYINPNVGNRYNAAEYKATGVELRFQLGHRRFFLKYVSRKPEDQILMYTHDFFSDITYDDFGYDGGHISILIKRIIPGGATPEESVKELIDTCLSITGKKFYSIK